MSDATIRISSADIAGQIPVQMKRAWKRSRRHTMLVRFLRILLPVIAGLIALAIFVSAIDFGPSLPSVKIGKVEMDGSSISMTNPELSGFGKNEEAYRVTAERAEQDLKNPKVVTLERVDGVMTDKDGRETTLSAANGRFNSENKTMILRDDVVVGSSTGYVAHLEVADVDMDKGIVISEKPVMIEGLDGIIRANSLEIRDKGAIINFRGKVVLDVKLQPKSKDGETQ